MIAAELQWAVAPLDVDDSNAEEATTIEKPVVSVYGLAPEQVQQGFKSVLPIRERWKAQDFEAGIRETWRLLRLGDSWVELAAFDCADLNDGWSAIKGHAILYVQGVEAAIKAALEPLGGRGYYVVPAALKEGLQTRYKPGAWSKSTTTAVEKDVLNARVLCIDLDVASRPKGTSSTTVEWGSAVGVMACVRDTLLRAGVSEAALGFGHSGNGAHVHVYTDSAWGDDVKALRVRILKSLAALCNYSGKTVKVVVDEAMSDGSRYIPLYGTEKRKGADGHKDRPWRWTKLVGPEHVEPLNKAQLAALADALEALRPSEALEANNKVAQISQASKPKTATSESSNGDSVFALVNRAPMVDVAAALGVDLSRCPGCAHELKAGDTSSGLIKHPKAGIDLWHCFHGSCAGKPNWTNVALILQAKGIGADDGKGMFQAVAEIAERLGIAVPKKKSRQAAPKSPNPESCEREDLPTVKISTNEKQTNDQAIAAMQGLADVYQRGGALVRIQGSEIKALPQATLREELSAIAVWKKWHATSGDWVDTHPPDRNVGSIFVRGDWGRPEIRGVVEAPCLLPDGGLVTEPGLHVASGIFLRGRLTVDVPLEPTREDALAALDVIMDLLIDFPFKGSIDMSAAIAAMLTPAVRATLSGPAPFFLFRATTPGSGKDLLAQCISLIWTGERVGSTPPTKDAEEIRKQLLTMAMSGSPLALFDDLHSFGNAVWAAGLTTTHIRGRILGLSVEVCVAVATTMIGTGNNTVVYGDCLRRVVVSMLESPYEDPENRPKGSYKHKDRAGNLESFVRENRAKLVSACLTILRAYQVAGTPNAPTWGSYEAWARVVAGALVWLELENPCTSYQALAMEGGTDREQIGALLRAWRDCYGDKAMKASEVLRRPKVTDDEDIDLDSPEATLTAALLAWAGTNGKLPTPLVLGQRLQKIKGRVVGGMKVTFTFDSHAKTHLWSVVAVTQIAGIAGIAGISGDQSVEVSPQTNQHDSSQIMNLAGIAGKDLPFQDPKERSGDNGDSPRTTASAQFNGVRTPTLLPAIPANAVSAGNNAVNSAGNTSPPLTGVTRSVTRTDDDFENLDELLTDYDAVSTTDANPAQTAPIADDDAADDGDHEADDDDPYDRDYGYGDDEPDDEAEPLAALAVPENDDDLPEDLLADV